MKSLDHEAKLSHASSLFVRKTLAFLGFSCKTLAFLFGCDLHLSLLSCKALAFFFSRDKHLFLFSFLSGSFLLGKLIL